MLLSLLFLMLRRYHQKYPEKAQLFFVRLRFVARVVFLILLMAGIAVYAFSQERVLQYIVKRNGDAVGNMIFKEIKDSNRVTYKLQSEVKTSFVFTITVKAIEEATYENGILTYSRFYQKVNSNERVNTEIQASGRGYLVISRQNVKPLNSYPITCNLICLYTMEPLHQTRIFSDKFQQFISIENVGLHHYRIKFPDGNYNEYFYQSGTCIKVKLNSTWFCAEMELKR